jgi:hypothetical protein
MSAAPLIIQTAFTFTAASVGAFLAAFLSRRTERFKHLQELRSAAYADFLRGVAMAAEQGQAHQTGTGGRALVADARARIAIYGGKKVVHSLAGFIALGAQTSNAEGMEAFAELCGVMRTETRREHVSAEDILQVLFNQVEGH